MSSWKVKYKKNIFKYCFSVKIECIKVEYKNFVKWREKERKKEFSMMYLYRIWKQVSDM